MTTYTVLSAIDQALNLGRLTYPEMHALAANATDASSREVVRGTLAAIGASPEGLAAELARARVLVRSGDFSRRMINEVVPPVDWKRAAPAKPDPIMLIAALQSRFAPILNGAVSLLADAAWSDELVPFIEPLLDSSRALTVYASALLLSEKVAGRLAVDMFAARLRSPVSSGCEYVYKVLGDLHRRSDATLQNEIAALLFAGLRADDSNVARGAAEALAALKLDPKPGDEEKLLAAYDAWMSSPLRCFSCGQCVEGHRCSKCNYSLSSPAPAIVRELGRRDAAPPLDRLRRDMSDTTHDVAKAVHEVARKRFAAHPDVLIDLVGKIHSAALRGESAPDAVFLPDILELPASVLRRVKSHLLDLAYSGPHRSTVLDALPNGWIATDEAEAVAREVIGEEDVISEHAVKILRRIRAAQT